MQRRGFPRRKYIDGPKHWRSLGMLGWIGNSMKQRSSLSPWWNHKEIQERNGELCWWQLPNWSIWPSLFLNMVYGFILFQCCGSRIVACKEKNLWIQLNIPSCLECSETITSGFLSGWRMAQLPRIDPSVWPKKSQGRCSIAIHRLVCLRNKTSKSFTQNQHLKNIGPIVLLANVWAFEENYTAVINDSVHVFYYTFIVDSSLSPCHHFDITNVVTISTYNIVPQ